MARVIIVACLLLTGLATAHSARAADGYDDPSLGTTPCVVLNRYELQRVGKRGAENPRFGARAEMENLCGRTVEVSFCFLYAQPVDGHTERCFDELLRPWSGDAVAHPTGPVRITGPSYHWRYLPVR
jgi:hypothetical protein